ncbi:cysteine synthase B [Candidatus Heimdallarchaeota archaeon B3_Heim]|nr:MAG: cysteine synthase B [Candidatus Heimdallarchaeota archaeon B3_Heim]
MVTIFVENYSPPHYTLEKHKHPPAFHYVGNTPLIELVNLPELAVFPDVRVFAKLEMFNFGGSVKDRIALYMLEELKSSGKLNGRCVIEPTSGNTGIGLAWVGRLLGIDITLVIPDSMSQERLDILRSYRARIISTPGEEGMDGAIRKAREMAQKFSKEYVMLDQFNNDTNWKTHYCTTGPEIWAQSHGNVDYLFAGLGTGGTIIGISRFLKEQNPNLKVYGVEPTLTGSIPGLKNTNAVKEVPGILRREELDGIFQIMEKDANNMTRRLASESSLLVGPSSGAVLHGILTWLKTEQNIKGTIVTVFPDSGQKYLSKGVFGH